MYCIGLVMRNSDTAIGSTSEVTLSGWPRRSREDSIIAGNEASEDCVLAATTCAGAIAEAKRRRRSRPAMIAMGYIKAVASRYIVERIAMYQPNAPIMP